MPLSPTTWTPRKPTPYYQWLVQAKRDAENELRYQKLSGYTWDSEWNCYRKVPVKDGEASVPKRQPSKVIKKVPNAYFQNKLKFKKKAAIDKPDV